MLYTAFKWARTPKIAPFRGRSQPHVIRGSFGPHQSPTKRHLDRFSRFAGLTNLTNRQTHKHTDHTTFVSDNATLNINVYNNKNNNNTPHITSNYCCDAA